MMNERIKELEKRCWDHQTNHLNAEKFAELIVRNCIAKCADLDSMKYIADHFDIKFDFDWMNDDQRI